MNFLEDRIQVLFAGNRDAAVRIGGDYIGIVVFVLVNARTRTYHYIEGMPDVGHIPNDGPYDLFASDLLKRSLNENEREEAAQLISFEHLTELMNQGNDVVSFNLHVPIGEEEWFTYNFIVISRDVDGHVS